MTLRLLASLFAHVLTVAHAVQMRYNPEDVVKYLIVSSPQTSRVAYLLLTDILPNATEGMRALVTTGLVSPQGIAVDDYRRYLYIADPGLQSIVRYKLVQDHNAIEAHSQEVVVEGVEVRWVAVDGLGNVFFSDEANHHIFKIPISVLEGDTSSGEAQLLYDGDNYNSVSGPGGVAVDNYRIYWVNKLSGTSVGSLVQGSELGSGTSGASVLASPAPKCYGVCMSRGNLYFTDEAYNLYGYNTKTGDVTTITSSLVEGRGCAGDGVGTVYVADKAAHAVYAVPGTSLDAITTSSVRKAVSVEGAYGVAVYTSAVR